MGKVEIRYPPEVDHNHGNISSDGRIGSVSGYAVRTGANGVLQAGTLPVMGGGTGQSALTSGYFMRGNGANAVTLTAPSAVLELIGGSKAVMGSYVGDGNTTYRDVYLGFQPKLLFVTINCGGVTGTSSKDLAVVFRTATGNANVAYIQITSTGFRVQYSGNYLNFNTANLTYHYIAFT